MVHTSAGPIPATRVVACAGAWSDRLAEASGESAEPRIIPFRGGYLKLRASARYLVRGMIYPVPDPSLPFLGVHLTKRIDGDVWLGPSALLAPSRTPTRCATSPATTSARPSAGPAPGGWPASLAHRPHRDALRRHRRAFVRACASYVPDLTADDVEPGPAGIRAQAVARDGKLLDDFAFAYRPGVLHVRNAPSPAATSSLAIARVIADRLDARS